MSSDVFGVVFLIAGAIKAFRFEQVRKAVAWTQAVPRALVQIIGLAEILGALGPADLPICWPAPGWSPAQQGHGRP